jgi:hypothetical protein
MRPDPLDKHRGECSREVCLKCYLWHRDSIRISDRLPQRIDWPIAWYGCMNMLLLEDMRVALCNWADYSNSTEASLNQSSR